MVDYIMQTTYADIDLEEEPVIIPACSHIMVLSSMDGHMGMSDYYELSEGSSVTALKEMPKAFSTDLVKSCPICRRSLRDINRYSRIVRQALLEEATKRFVTWANRQYLPLRERLDEVEKRLHDSLKEGVASVQRASQETHTQALVTSNIVRLEHSMDEQLRTIKQFPGLTLRHQSVLTLRTQILQFLAKVKEEEQPFGRVWDMVQDVRRRHGITGQITMDRTALNTRNRMLASALLIRCDLTILSDFIRLRDKARTVPGLPDWAHRELQLKFTSNRQACSDLMTEALQRDQPSLEVEARIYFARWVILERSVLQLNLNGAQTLFKEAQEQLEIAKTVCAQNPGSTRGMPAEVSAIEKMLLHSTAFYTPVDNEEKRQVYAAMAQQFSGTGHWYTCANGHPFTVGECGMPMEQSVCPQCGAPIGGESHQAAAGVRRAQEFDDEFGRLRLG